MSIDYEVQERRLRKVSARYHAFLALRSVPRLPLLDERVRSLRDAWVRGDEVDL